MKRWGWIALLPALAGGLDGCMVGPDFHRPAPRPAEGFATAPPADTVSTPGPGGAAQRFVAADVPERWWTAFQSPAIDALEERALHANPDLQSAEAALKGAQEILAAQKGVLYPQVGFAFNANRQKNPGVLASPLASNANFFSLYTGQLTVGYTPDLFGGLRRQIEAVAAQADNQRELTRAAYLTLTANVALAALQASALKGQVAATAQAAATNEAMLRDLRTAFAHGQAAAGDVAAQESAVAQARLLLPPLQKALAQQQDLLDVLVGGTPADGAVDVPDLDSVTLPADLPLSLPSRLVAQRPDIRAAEANLHVASAQIGVAQANRLPSVTLTGAMGGTSTAIGNLLSSDNTLYSLAGGLTQPIFQGGTLRYRERAARAAYAQAEASYRSTVHTAFQNVADTLAALDQDARNLQAASLAEAAAGRTYDVARRQFTVGEAARAVMLAARQAHEASVAGLVQARAARYADTVALYQALGGGWSGPAASLASAR